MSALRPPFSNFFKIMKRITFASLATLGLCSVVSLVFTGCLEGSDIDNPDAHATTTAGTTTTDAMTTTDATTGMATTGTTEMTTTGGSNCDMPTLIETNCGSAACHQGDAANPEPFGVLELVAVDPQTLVGKPAVYPAEANANGDCPVDAPELIIDPTNPAASLMLTKLKDTQACGEGMPSPFSFSYLGDAEYACFEEWVMGLASAGSGN